MIDTYTDYDLIDLQPMKNGYGRIWQGGVIFKPWDLTNIPSPVAIVAMNPEHNDFSLIDHSKFFAVLHVGIEDRSDCTIQDNVFLGLVDACVGMLKNGINLYIHCMAGISRSTYLDVAIHMRLLDISYEDALETMYQRRCLIGPNSGFSDQLKRLEPRLRNGE